MPLTIEKRQSGGKLDSGLDKALATFSLSLLLFLSLFVALTMPIREPRATVGASREMKGVNLNLSTIHISADLRNLRVIEIVRRCSRCECEREQEFCDKAPLIRLTTIK